jgi:DNA-directed RNA polymerase subunit M/transcription elongation factor TFIIS
MKAALEPILKQLGETVGVVVLASNHGDRLRVCELSDEYEMRVTLPRPIVLAKLSVAQLETIRTCTACIGQARMFAAQQRRSPDEKQSRAYIRDYEQRAGLRP